MPCVIEAHGARYEVEDPGGLIGKSLRSGNPYEARVLEHIYRRGFKGLAVDVGASVGNHSLWLAVVCGLQVIAVEPLDYLRLRENIRRNDLGRQVTMWPLALGERAGRAAVTGAPAHVIGRSFPEDGKVPLARLDDFKLRDLALLKIDVEGMEVEVLRGGRETIDRERPVIYAEAQDEAAHARLAEELVPRGYRHEKTFGATPLEEWEPC